MAAPATHLLLAKKVFSTYFADKNPKDFYVGTSFPDIRYLGIIDRTGTHVANPSIPDLLKLSSFAAGVQFHSLVDVVREDFVTASGAYALLPESPYVTQALKLFEDQVLYERLEHWGELTPFFDEVLPEEKAYELQTADIQKWHTFLQTYLATPPTDQSVRVFVAAIGRPAEMAEEIIMLVQGMKENRELKKIAGELYENFEKLMANSPAMLSQIS